MAALLVDYDLDASLFCVANRRGSKWVFLDELAGTATNIPSAVVELVGEFTSAIHGISSQTLEMREAGYIGHYQQLMEQIDKLQTQRSHCIDAYMRPRPALRNSGVSRAAAAPLRAQTTAAAAAPGSSSSPAKSSRPVKSSGVKPSRGTSSSRVEEAVSALLHDHYCVIDDFVGESEAVALHSLLLSMRSGGELLPGQVSGGLQQARRGDLMRWVSTEVRAQPPELYNLLAEMDGLISALSLDHRLATDLGNGRRLLRHEMQVTCYPGGGACYVRHVDDALVNRARVLTCILYSNPGWQPSHGGSLRAHVARGARDVEPLNRRLLVFWSDSRVPHEVLPAYADRFAVSIWYSDADAVGAASKAEREAREARKSGEVVSN